MSYCVSVTIACCLLFGVSCTISAQDFDRAERCELVVVSSQYPDPEQVVSLILEKQARIDLARGESRLTLNCYLNKQSVFTFDQEEVIALEAIGPNVALQRLAGTSPSFLLPAGEFTAELKLIMHNRDSKVFVWQSLAHFLDQSLLNSITMGAFFGLCMVLILYVSFMGKMLGDKSFQLYSLYVFCASTFFLLQEGQLHIFLPEKSFLFDHQFYILFAGLTVFSATLFIVRIVDIQQDWPKFTRLGLYPAAIFVMLISGYTMFTHHTALSNFLGILMARLTLLIMCAILVLVMIQTYRRVKMAWLVCVSLLFMVIAMVFRTLLDVGEFLERYGLILAFAIEAFIFAIVVSSRIEHIRTGKLIAEIQANTDSLCEVLNRRGWMAKAEDLLQLQRERGGTLALLYIDLNDFKIINDTYGHHCGDKVLSIIAKIIRSEARKVDIVGRVGGDEFVVAGYFEQAGESKVITDRLRTRLSDMTLQIDADLQIQTSASVGNVIFDAPPANVSQMLKMADQSMYKHKRNLQSFTTADGMG